MYQNDTNKAIYMVLFYDVLIQCSRRECSVQVLITVSNIITNICRR